MIEDGRTVLRAPIGALAVQRGWIVVIPENIEQFAVADAFRIKRDFHHFGVAGRVGTHLFIGGVLHLAARITDPRRTHAGQTAKCLLDAPETASVESSLLFHDYLLDPKSGILIRPSTT